MSNYLYLDSGTLTPLLKTMEKKGWVVRKRSSKDERLLNVSITEAGEALREKAIVRTGFIGVLQMHGFYIEPELKRIRFDLVVAFDIEKSHIIAELHHELAKKYPEYQILIIPDIDA